METYPEIICAGELLMDLISTEYAADFRAADRYLRVPGGSPANLAMNLARRGRRPALVAAVGRDDAGDLLTEEVTAAGVNVRWLARVAEPTTLVLVTKSRAVSNFEAYRLADRFISATQFPEEIFSTAKIFHTTAFALSRQPARTAILNGAERAVAAGARLSVDFNYAPKIWPDREEALDVLKSYLAHGALAKFSEVDYARLFGEEVTDPERAAQRIKNLGAHLVCLTLGERGCFVLHESGSFFLPARPVAVRDTTGAGDAFWSGFLAAVLGGYDWRECAVAGRALAERKLSVVGPLREKVELTELLK